MSDACSLDPACERHYLQARTLFKAGQLAEALNEYHQAYSIQRVPTLLFNIARLNHKLGRLKEAASSYEAYLNQDAGTEAALKSKAKEYLTEIQRELPPAETSAPSPAKPVEKPASADSTPQPPAVILVPPPPVEKPSAATPIYKRWWLWTAVGGAVVAGTVGIIIGTQVDPRPRPDLLFDLRDQL